MSSDLFVSETQSNFMILKFQSYVYVHYYIALYMYELLYCNDIVCTICTACSGVVCGNSIVICCIVSPSWPPQGPSDTYQHS